METVFLALCAACSVLSVVTLVSKRRKRERRGWRDDAGAACGPFGGAACDNRLAFMIKYEKVV